MSNPSKRRGTQAENAVVEALRAGGFIHAERRGRTSNKDRGDIAGIPGLVIEVKNCRKMALAEWLAEAEVERVNDGADLAVVYHKRVGKGDAADWYVTMSGATFMQFLAEWTRDQR